MTWFVNTCCIPVSPYLKFIDRRILQQYGKLHLSIPFGGLCEHFPQELIAIEIYRVLPQMFLLFSIALPKWRLFTTLPANHSSQEKFKSIKKLLLAECFPFQRWKFGWVWKHTLLSESTSIIHRLHHGRRDKLRWWYNVARLHSQLIWTSMAAHHLPSEHIPF